ncbi:beta-glucosidase 12-like [Lolium perenne]|uniref:beta-glucosidase 12-like n=1 Tax=Lolium perenne TaxID=4522 RepID=UPI003A9A04A9
MAAGELATMPGRAVLTFLLLAVASAAYDSVGLEPVSRRSFPKGFVFGTASSSYQYEGGAMEGGRGPSIWDNFTHQYPDKIFDKSNGDVAVDSYHLYKEDVRLMKDMGMDAYRFSISWTRILPDGTLRGGVNKEGIRYYNNLINELLSKGLQPFVTLFHWDSPQALEDEYTGFLSHNIINDYKDYAEVCFKEFGDRVKHWITFNEPLSFCVASYAMGVLAPGRCSPWEAGKCSAGDSGTEPYTVGHHQLLAHAAAFKLYKQKYQAVQKGKVGITLVTNWYVPFSHSKSDNAAAKRAIDFMLGWFMEPLKRGVYPQSMRKLVGNRLPQFTKEQSELVKGSFDFIGMNYYTANYAANLPPSDDLKKSYNTDAQANLTGVRNGVPIGPQAGTTPGTSWLYVYPQGFRDLMLYIKENYGNPTVYVTENGIGEPNNKSLTIQQALKDHARIDYHHKHLLALQSAIRDGANVKGYFAWSLLDDFEWVSGYTVRFGLHFVDYSDGQKRKRYPKQSARWFKKFLKR